MFQQHIWQLIPYPLVISRPSQATLRNPQSKCKISESVMFQRSSCWQRKSRRIKWLRKNMLWCQSSSKHATEEAIRCFFWVRKLIRDWAFTTLLKTVNVFPPLMSKCSENCTSPSLTLIKYEQLLLWILVSSRFNQCNWTYF